MSEERILALENEIKSIKERNLKVEADKAWETSLARIAMICIITYFIAVWVMAVIGVTNYWLSALIPTIGFYLSVQSLPVVKRWWVKHYVTSKE